MRAQVIEVEKIVEVPKIEYIEREKIVEVPKYVEQVIEKPIYIEKPPVEIQIRDTEVEVRYK